MAPSTAKHTAQHTAQHSTDCTSPANADDDALPLQEPCLVRGALLGAECLACCRMPTLPPSPAQALKQARDPTQPSLPPALRFSDHPLGRTPCAPRAGVPGSRTMPPPHGPRRILRPPPGLDSPSPQAGVHSIAGGPLPTAPRAVRQCIAGVRLPTAPRQCGTVLQELHCPLPPGSEAVHCRSSTAHCPQGSGAVHCRSSTAHCPRAVRQCVAGVPLPTAPRQ